MIEIPVIAHRFVEVDGVRVFYRETGPRDAPTLVLLHGFPSASHQFRRLMDALGGRYHLIAPDYPGFGHTSAPEDFVYSFDRLADITEGFLEALGLRRFIMYVFDFGGPVGFRIAERHPEWIAGLIVQNANAYTEGLSDGARDFIALTPETPGSRDVIGDLLTLDGTRGQYETGVSDPHVLDPDAWTLDQHFLDAPGRKQAQLTLAFDYHSNLERYDAWQLWLRTHTPPTLILWGRYDPFFPEPGAHAYLADVPQAELHLFDTGHFALETHLPEIAPRIADFADRVWDTGRTDR
ncbi:alpha/beta hydrolase [Nocardia sp. NPDC050378]|uniref:alpha/beta fold hydrolase n=1 Tax=Nocardia sp. NPDC050378 TaxID=3155400 RepID=UPI0033C0BB6C